MADYQIRVDGNRTFTVRDTTVEALTSSAEQFRKMAQPIPNNAVSNWQTIATGIEVREVTT